ncbi:putative inorganic phosphate cotransporter isoform X2 [Stegodyphus dumicola]|uniref:putative inorganic phosphate cotransporter isoform X2 n=1 Tax=Stegodyphus dumicola TaxID=202533 RepID=UPI0015AD803A|nr:putative inorganic phosphate cotransporter isoform X2 [Stegodyphus dumicola]
MVTGIGLKSSSFAISKTHLAKRSKIFFIDASYFSSKKMPLPKAGSSNKRASRSIIPRRYIVAVLCFFSFMVLNMQRLNLSIALVAMVNSSSTNLTLKEMMNRSECPTLWIENDTSEPISGLVSPAVSCLMAKWYPKLERGFLSSLSFSGYPAGAFIGGIVSGALCDSSLLGGWPSVFYVFGAWGLIVAVLLQLLIFNAPEEDANITEAEYKYILSHQESNNKENKMDIPWGRMFSSVSTWALLAGMFGQYWMTFYFISVYPNYLATVLNFSVTQSGLISSAPYILQMLTMWFSSYFSDRMLKKEYATVDNTRKICNTLSCAGFSLSLLCASYAGCDITLNTVLFVIAMSCIGFGFPGSLTVPLDMTSEFAGTLMGMSCTIASTSGFIIPLVVGFITSQEQTIAQWHKILYISAAVSIGSGVIFHIFGSAELQTWSSSNDQASAKEDESAEFRDERSSEVKPKDSIQTPQIYIIRL